MPAAAHPTLRPLLIAGTLATMALIGLGLIRLDERLGTAHLPPALIRAARPHSSAPLPDQPDPYASSRAVSFDSPATTIDHRAPGTGTAPDTSPLTDRRYAIRRILPITGPIRYGQWFWDEAAVPPGPLVITVDLDARVLSVFRNGYEIGATAVLLGTQEKPTPLGTFPITQKDVHHISNLYDAPMPYMLRLTNDGVTIHATTVRNGYASHGCIGVPLDFARKLFSEVHLHDKVYITRGKQVGLGDSLVD